MQQSVLLRVLSILIVTYLSSGAAAAAPELIEIQESVMQNTEGAYKGNVLRLSKAILRSSKRHGVPYRVLTAVLAVESSYRLSAVNKKSNDYGIAQINQWNIEAHKLDKTKLLTDLEYSIDAGAMILAYFYKRYADHKPRRWVLHYNCGTRDKCIEMKQVKHYFVKLQRFGARL